MNPFHGIKSTNAETKEKQTIEKNLLGDGCYKF